MSVMISRGQGFSYPFLLHYWFHLVLNKKLKNIIRNRILLNAKGLILKANGLNSNMLSTTFQSETCLPQKNEKKLIWTVFFSSFCDLAITLESWEIVGYSRCLIVWLTVQGHPCNVNFRKISVRKTIWDLEFSEHFL